MIDGYIICFLASFVILVWCYGSSHGFFGDFIYINRGKVTNTHQRLSFDLHRFAFISPRLYEWDRVHLYSDVYIKSKKIWAFSTHGPALFFGGFLLYADFAFECHSRSCCSLVQFIGSHLSLKPSWAERDRTFILFRCLPAAWSTCRMLWDVCHGVCCICFLVSSLWVFFFFFLG